MPTSDLKKLFSEVKNIAVWGMSRAANKPSHTVPRYMLEQGYKIIPINPYADEILGQKAYKSLLDVPDRIDLVNVFRLSQLVPPVVDEALERRAQRGDIDWIWLQLGISNEESRLKAESAGVKFLQNRCIYVDHMQVM